VKRGTEGCGLGTEARVRVQALAIHSGKERDLHYLTSLHNHLSFHHMFDRTQLAEVTCVAEWESGFIDDVLPCRPGDRPVARAQLRSRKLIV